MHKYHGVIFDLDGIITDMAKYHYLAWRKLAAEIGIHIDEDFNEKIKGVSRLESLDLIIKYGGSGKAAGVFSLKERIRLAEKKNEYYRDMIKKMTPADILPGVIDLMYELKKSGVKLAVASASKNASIVLRNLDIADKFDYIVDAALIQNGKPDPEIFLAAATGLRLDVRYCAGIEDSAVGIEAIKRAGMFAIGIGDPNILKKADVVLPDLSDTSGIIRLLEG